MPAGDRERQGPVFGPVMLAWFAILGIMGVANILGASGVPLAQVVEIGIEVAI